MSGRKKDRTQITVETHEVTTVRMRNGWPGLRYCSVCGQGVCGLSRTQAAAIFEVGEHLLGELFDSKQIHEIEDAAICGNSLSKYFS
jgi:hypothetical protein